MENRLKPDEGKGVKVLIVDDDPDIVRLVGIHLKKRGYDPLGATNAEEAVELAEENRPNVILLDINMPGTDGISSIPRFRQVCNASIVMLSSMATSDAKVEALDRGADDFLAKPFDPDELAARIRVAVRHNRVIQNLLSRAELPVVSDDFLEIDLNQRTVQREGELLRLSRLEFQLLEVLVTNLNRVLTRREILQKVWGADYGDESDILRTLIKQLRRKIEPDPANPRYLTTEGRIGYRFIFETESSHSH